MAVLAKKTEQRCKLCRSPHRDEIDALLELRSNGATDEDGRRINGEYVLERLGQEFGVTNPTLDNIKSHWGPTKHSYVVSEQEASEHEAELDELHRQMLEVVDAADDSVDGKLRALFNLGFLRVRQRILKGQDPGVSLDHMQKFSAELTKRQDNETKRDLMAVLGGGIMAALAQPKQPKQIEGAEVIDAGQIEMEAVVISETEAT